MKDFSFITNSHPSYIETIYKDYLDNPENVDADLKKFFEGFDYAIGNFSENGASKAAEYAAPGIGTEKLLKEFNVYQLIEGYRTKGHLVSDTNPIRPRKNRHANLDLSYYNLSDSDLDTQFVAGKLIGLENATLKAIVEKLKRVYTSSVGAEFHSIYDEEQRAFIIEAMEEKVSREFDIPTRRRILDKTNQAVIFEKFLHTKYIGQKRFSLEGGEALIPALNGVVFDAAEDGVKEIVIGMAHRGRLNVLANTLGKTYEQIFSEFEGIVPPEGAQGSGDVKYHLGFRSDYVTANNKKINLQLMANPSHLEVVGPVTLGFARGKSNTNYNTDFSQVVPILIHGDAAQAGQGIIYEVAQMSGLAGYNVGGAIHITVNNQIGFTTDYDDARSSFYCTSVADVTKSPVFHVNGDHIESVVKVAQIAFAYRQKFKKDVFIDILCYRRHGHNEGDEPKFTQPKLYALIDNHPNPREVYVDYLLKNGDHEAKELAKEMEQKFWADLQERLDEVKQKPLAYQLQEPEKKWRGMRFAKEEDFLHSPETGVDETLLRELTGKIFTYPENFNPLRKIKKLLEDKMKLYESEQKLDWGTAELLAYASILHEGKDVRISGEDVKRGTFAHRHAVLYDEETNEQYNRLDRLKEGQGKLRIFNSLLSEYGVLAYEYGYSTSNPEILTIWEAQYGDFANGAQMVIDEYVASAEEKWGTMSGLVMLLPHGYEGAGPDHSSARPERFLQGCAELNNVVVNITTAANFFHALRRQLAWTFRKPLIVMSPKANLRHPGSYSHITELTTGSFKEVIDDATVSNPEQIKKVLLCSGKIYFELMDKKLKDSRNDVALVRLEQLYPLPENQLIELKNKYANAIWFWTQEEPLNMGAATYLQTNFKAFPYGIISRNAAAATATGYAKVHRQEQQDIIETAFSI